MLEGTLPIIEMRFSTEVEQSVAAKFIEYCAGKLGMESEEYLTTVVGSPAYTKSLGVYLGPQVSDALQTYMKGGATLTLSAAPSSQLQRLDSHKFFSPEDLVTLSNLAISINGEDVAIEITADQPEESSSEVTQEEIAVEEKEAPRQMLQPVDPNSPDAERVRQKQKEVAALQGAKLGFLPIKIGAARNYIDHDIRLTRTGDRPPLLGRLTSISEGVLIIETYQHGGLAKFSVPISRIAKIEVYKRLN